MLKFKRAIKKVNEKIKFDNGTIDESHLETTSKTIGYIRNNGGYVCDHCQTRHETDKIKIAMFKTGIMVNHVCILVRDNLM